MTRAGRAPHAPAMPVAPGRAAAATPATAKADCHRSTASSAGSDKRALTALAPSGSKQIDSRSNIDMIAIGDSIYKQTKEGEYNFVNALYDHALEFFGDEFIDEEVAKPFAQRHPAMQWLLMAVERDEQLEREGYTDARARQTGEVAPFV